MAQNIGGMVVAILADRFARVVVFAIGQPGDVDIRRRAAGLLV